MQKTRSFRSYSLIVLLAFILNTIMPFFAVYNIPANEAQAKHLSSVFGENILLCTADGFKWVKLADLQNGKENPKPHSDIKCAVCYVARHGTKDMLPAFAALVPEPTSVAASAVAVYAPLLIPFYLSSSLQARAPPASFIG